MKFYNPRLIFYNFICTCFGLFLSFVTLETFARLLPASSSFELEKPIICKKKLDLNCLHRRKKFHKARFTKGKFPPFEIDTLKSTNDFGQFSNINFSDFKKNENDLIRVISIGDSYVEALQVDNEKSFHGLLNKQSIKHKNKKLKFISTAFGSSGMALPNYVKSLEFIADKEDLKNDFVIITIIPNDFDQSFLEYVGTSRRSEKGQFFFDEKGDFIFKDFKVEKGLESFISFALRHSSFIRYLIYNTELISSFKTSRLYCLLTYPRCEKESFTYKANIIDENISTNPRRYKKGYQASEFFIKEIKKLRSNSSERKKTILVFDSQRSHIYGEDKKGDYYEAQKKYLIKIAKKDEFTIIDMEKFFKDDFLVNNRKFNSTIDFHWNEYGHQVVAAAILNQIENIYNK
tara:strand:- start:1970 stop:3181 length:1212 start_codon:yes stop_codon:yes gene_type:complete